MRVQAPDGSEREFDVLSIEEAIAKAVEEFDLPRRTLDNRQLVWTVRQDGTVLRTGPPTPGDWLLDAEGGPEALAEIDEAIGEIRQAISSGTAADTPHLMTKLTLLRRTGAREVELEELDEQVRGARRGDTRAQRSRQRSALALPLIGAAGIVAVGLLVFISVRSNPDRPRAVFEPEVIEGLPAVIDGEISTRGEIDSYELDLESGQGIEIRMNGSGGFQEMDTELRLRAPGGNEVAYNDDFNGLNSRIVHAATENGTYVIEASALGGCCVGAYRLTVDPIDAEGLEGIDMDVVLPFVGEGSIGAPGVYDRYRVTMAAGEAFSAQAFGGAGAFGGQFDMEMRVYDEQFFELAYNDDFNGLDPRIDWIAAVDGVYVVEVGALGGRDVGGYRIEIDSIDPDDAQQDPFFGEGFEGEFGDQFLGDSVSGVDFGSYEGEIAEFGQYDEFSLELVEGQAIRVSMDALAEGLDPYLRLYNETRAIVAENDDFNGLNSRFDYIAPRTAVYTIRAAGLGGSSIGAYVVTIDEIDPGDANVTDEFFFGESEGEPGDMIEVVSLPFEFEGSLDFPGEFDIFDVFLDAGQAIRVDHQATDGMDPYLTLRVASNGQELASNDDFQSLDSRIEFVAPAADIYRIEARSLGNCCAGSYIFTIEEIDPGQASADMGQFLLSGFSGGTSFDVSIPFETDGEIYDLFVADEYFVDLDAGETIVASAEAVESFGEAFDLAIVIGDPSDALVAGNDDRGDGSLNPQVVYTAQVAGTHLVQVRALGGASTGVYYLTIEEAAG